ncbi:6-phospho-beta-galactosidase [Mammaliicoccus sciuri]|uniref:6-phospho-beta-galactosidase n=1 Tax=Mammaliicoccus sciuri TaxID=1296 RepID=UPI001330F1C1|nr:6-phospho-beta-galactosidase [Mammaliicoccus sciuri]
MLELPKTFVLGAATAAYQVEGSSKVDGKGRVLWDEFLERQGRFSPDPASDFYNRYEEDIKLSSEHGIKALRISIAWSRIFPKGYGDVNQKGVTYYKNVFATCRKYNIEPYVTLHHFDTPEELFKQGDWLCKENITHFVNYAAFCFEIFKDDVQYWMTINEPIAYTLGQYVTGAFPPGEQYQVVKCLQAQHNLIVAHSKVVKLYKEKGYNGEIGIIHALTQIYPIDQQPENVNAAKVQDTFINGFLLDGTFLGAYSSEKMDVINHLLNKYDGSLDMPEEEMAIIKEASQLQDFLGINYYQSNWVKANEADSLIHHNGTGDKGSSIFRLKQIAEIVKNHDVPTTDWDWYIYPKGLYDMIMRIKADYPNYKKLLITENGLGYKDQFIDEQTIIDDQPRIDYIATHLESISDAIKDGANVTGYFVWSLQDMFSWSNGYNKRYGLFYIDFETQKRYIKKSALWYKALSESLENKTK